MGGVQESGEGFAMAFAAGGTAEPGRSGRSSREVGGTQRTPVVDLARPTVSGDGDAFLGQMGREVRTVVERGGVDRKSVV